MKPEMLMSPYTINDTHDIINKLLVKTLSFYGESAWKTQQLPLTDSILKHQLHISFKNIS